VRVDGVLYETGFGTAVRVSTDGGTKVKVAVTVVSVIMLLTVQTLPTTEVQPVQVTVEKLGSAVITLVPPERTVSVPVQGIPAQLIPALGMVALPSVMVKVPNPVPFLVTERVFETIPTGIFVHALQLFASLDSMMVPTPRVLVSAQARTE
jgi:hypothetical protein